MQITSITQSNRVPTFDIMKGIGILVMIIGHTYIPSPMSDFIFVWHMPLFFILSGYFFKMKPMDVLLKNNLRTLFIPYLLTALVIFLFALLYEILGRSGFDALHYFIAIFVGSGSPKAVPLSEYSNGAIWFLLALFWCRLIFNGLLLVTRGNERVLFLSSFGVAIVGICASRYVFIPTNLLQGMGALLFFSTGFAVKKRLHQIRGMMLPLSFVFCGLSMWSGSMSMVSNTYSNLALNYMGAVTMVYAVYRLSVFLSHSNHWFVCLLTHIGKISLLVLCVHDVHNIFSFLPEIRETLFPSSPYIYIMVFDAWKLVFPLVVSVYIYRFLWVRRVFNLS